MVPAEETTAAMSAAEATEQPPKQTTVSPAAITATIAAVAIATTAIATTAIAAAVTAAIAP
jgi:hypothetical protein